MENKLKVDLQTLARGIRQIEVAYMNGLCLVPNGKEVDVRRNPDAKDYNREQAQLVVRILARNKQDVLSITSDPEHTRDILAQSQKRMADAQTWLLTHMDLWDRLEKAYRMLFPEDTGCIRGEQGCLDNAVVCCKACERGSRDVK